MVSSAQLSLPKGSAPRCGDCGAPAEPLRHSKLCGPLQVLRVWIAGIGKYRSWSEKRVVPAVIALWHPRDNTKDGAVRTSLMFPRGFDHLLASLAIAEARRNRLFMAIHHPARSLSFTIESFEQ